MIKKLFLCCFLLFYSNVVAHSLEFFGKFTEGGVIKGKTSPNSELFLDNKKLKIKSCESLFNKNSKHLHTTSLVKYPVFDKGKNYSGSNILKKKILTEFIEKNFLKELKTLKKAIIIPLGNTVSSTIEYLNNKYDLKLACFLKGFPHPSGANARKNIQFKENKRNMKILLRNK